MYGAQQSGLPYHPEHYRYQRGNNVTNFQDQQQQQQQNFPPQYVHPSSFSTAPPPGFNLQNANNSTGYQMENYQQNQRLYQLSPQAVGVPMNQSQYLSSLYGQPNNTAHVNQGYQQPRNFVPPPPGLGGQRAQNPQPASWPQQTSRCQAPGDEIVFSFNVPFIPALAMSWVARYPGFFEEALSRMRSGPPPSQTQNQTHVKPEEKTNGPLAESVESGPTNEPSLETTQKIPVEVSTNVTLVRQIEKDDVVENEFSGLDTYEEMSSNPLVFGAETVSEITNNNADASIVEESSSLERNSSPLIPQIEPRCSVDASSEEAPEELEPIIPGGASPMNPTKYDHAENEKSVANADQLATASPIVVISQKSIARANRKERQKVRDAQKAEEQILGASVEASPTSSVAAFKENAKKSRKSKKAANSNIKKDTPAVENTTSSEKKSEKNDEKKNDKKARDSHSDDAINGLETKDDPALELNEEHEGALRNEELVDTHTTLLDVAEDLERQHKNQFANEDDVLAPIPVQLLVANSGDNLKKVQEDDSVPADLSDANSKTGAHSAETFAQEKTSEEAPEEPEPFVPSVSLMDTKEYDDTENEKAVATVDELAADSPIVVISKKSIARANRKERQKIREAAQQGLEANNEASSTLSAVASAVENTENPEKKSEKTKKNNKNGEKACVLNSDDATDAQNQSSSSVPPNQLEKNVRGPENVDVTPTGESARNAKMSKIRMKTQKKNEREVKRRQKEKPAMSNSIPSSNENDSSSFKNEDTNAGTPILPNGPESKPGPKIDVTEALLAALAKRCRSNKRSQKSISVSKSQNEQKPDTSCSSSVSSSALEKIPLTMGTNEVPSQQHQTASEANSSNPDEAQQIETGVKPPCEQSVEKITRDPDGIDELSESINRDLLYYYKKWDLQSIGRDGESWENRDFYKMLFTKFYMYQQAMLVFRTPFQTLRLKNVPNLHFQYDPTGLLEKIIEFLRINPMRVWRNEFTEKTFNSLVEGRIQMYKSASNPTDKKLHNFFRVLLSFPDAHVFWDDFIFLNSQFHPNSLEKNKQMEFEYLKLFDRTVIKYILHPQSPEILKWDNLPLKIRSLVGRKHFDNFHRYLANMFRLRYDALTPTERLSVIDSLSEPQKDMLTLFETCRITKQMNWRPEQTEGMLKRLLESVLRMEKSDEADQYIKLYMFLLRIESTVLDGDCCMWSTFLDGPASTLEENKKFLAPWFF